MLTLPVDLARTVLDDAPDALIVIDADGIIRFVNHQALTFFGYGRDELVGQRVERLLPERFRGHHVMHRAGYFAAPCFRPMGAGLALVARRCDGGELPVEISLSPIEGANPLLVAAAIRDVSERKRVEAELSAAREASERAREAADHLREVADESRQSADRANQSKSRFLATASHDLRQPLQTLALLNGALRRMVTSQDAVEVLAQQEHAVATMSRLLNALLDISKLESGAVKPELRDFRIGTVLASIRREFAPLAESKGLELIVESAEDSVRSDPALVEQILKNLVSNAVKYTRAGRVAVRCRHEDTALRIEVVDTGVGIAAAQLAYIYDEFYQIGVPANSSREGYGLGLSIVQRLVKLLNVRLEVISEVGKGSVFTLLLPPAQATVSGLQSTEARPWQAERPAAGGAQVLLVEDDASVRDATGMLLRVEGYRVTAVASLSEAVRAAAERPPELLVTDYHLGNRELGTEVIAALRDRVSPDLKAILLTGDTSAAIKEMRSDPNLRILSKPVNAEELLRLLRALLTS